jgi:hypothetical protein
MATLSSISVDFRAGFSTLQQDINSVKGIFEKGTKDIESTLAVLKKGAMFAAVALGLNEIQKAFMDTTKSMDEMLKSSQKLGIGVEELSKLKYAAQMSGIEFSALESSLKKFSKTINTAFTDVASDSAKAFQALGIAITDASGQIKGTDVLIAEIAEAFAKMPDGAQKAALAMELFGKSGADLIPLLNMGKEGIVALYLEAERFGVVVSQDAAVAAEAFNDNIERLGFISQNATKTLVVEFLPALNYLAEMFIADTEASQGLRDATHAVGQVLVQVTAIVVAAANALVRLSLASYESYKAMAQFLSLNISGGIESAKKAIEGTKSAVTTSIDLYKGMTGATLKIGESSKKATGGLSDFSKGVGKAGKAAKEAKVELTDFQKLMADLVKTYAKLGQNGDNSELAKLQLTLAEGNKKLSESELEYLTNLAKASDELKKVNDEQKAHESALDGVFKKYQDVIDPLKKYYEELYLLIELEKLGTLTSAEYGIAVQKLGEDMAKATSKAKENDLDGMIKDLQKSVEAFGKGAADAFVEFATTGKMAFGDLVASILKDLAKMLLYKGVFGPMFNFIGGSLGIPGMNNKTMAVSMGEEGSSSRAFNIPSEASGVMTRDMGSATVSSGDTVINTTINMESGTAQTSNNNPSDREALALSKKIESAIKDVLVKEKRPGGLLSVA